MQEESRVRSPCSTPNLEETGNDIELLAELAELVLRIAMVLFLIALLVFGGVWLYGYSPLLFGLVAGVLGTLPLIWICLITTFKMH